ncbi:MAG: ABC-2 type transport system ATP-binding protein [Gammaproteobacteria bacterium]|jgi:ABC-2 type transport system ATP-binding protein
MSNEPLIVVDSVNRYYGSRHALHNISFAARNGEVTGFLGPNGAGKSSLMQIICGVMAATSGKVFIAGYNIFHDPLLAKANIGYLPEQLPLYPECSVDEYLKYCARLRKITSNEIKQKIEISKEKCGLEKVGNRIIGNLSKGYQQRVGFAQAIVHSPQILILDEPGSGLDPTQIADMRELISKLGKDHCVILSTHILTEAQSICDRILILNSGKIVLDQSMQNLTKNNVNQGVIVAFKNPPATLETIIKLVGITDANKIGENRFQLSGNQDLIITSISEAASLNHWGLIELIKVAESLEQIYLQLTKANSET